MMITHVCREDGLLDTYKVQDHFGGVFCIVTMVKVLYRFEVWENMVKVRVNPTQPKWIFNMTGASKGFRKVLGVLKDSTKVGLANLNSDYRVT